MISRSKDLIELKNTRSELLYITLNYGLLPNLLLKLETVNLYICESISIYATVQKKLSDAKDIIEMRLNSIITKNINFPKIHILSKVLDGTQFMSTAAVNNLSSHGVNCFKFEPVTSLRSFSKYKNMLRPNRQLI